MGEVEAVRSDVSTLVPGVEHLVRLIAAYLSHDEDNKRDRTVREFVTEFRGLARTAKQKAVLDATGLSRAPLSSLRNCNSVDGGCSRPAAHGGDASQQRAGQAGRFSASSARTHFRGRVEQAGWRYGDLRLQAGGRHHRRPSVDHRDGIWVHAQRCALLAASCPASTGRPASSNPFRQIGKMRREPRHDPLSTTRRCERACRPDPAHGGARASSIRIVASLPWWCGVYG